MMKKVQLLIALFVMLAQYAFAQGGQATVYLNNGSILNGQLAKSNTENKYRMRISNGSVIFFNGNDVKSIRNNTTPLPNATGMAGEAGTAYLHNGSIIKGKLQKSGNSNKYRAVLPNGSIFFFSGNLLKSIEYEQADDWGDEREDEWEDKRGDVPVQARRDERITNRFLPDPPKRRITGYRGFLDAGWTFSRGATYSYYDYNGYGRPIRSEKIDGYMEITTTHGGQIGPYFFIGGGAGVQYYPDLSEFALPVYLDMRINFINVERFAVSPFFKLQLGGLVMLQDGILGEAGSIGVYGASYFGCKFMTGGKTAINLQAGYSYISEYIHGISLKIGFEL